MSDRHAPEGDWVRRWLPDIMFFVVAAVGLAAEFIVAGWYQ